jgi:hypothetical protein
MDESDETLERIVQDATRDAPPRLAEDEFYQALASCQRRRLLSYLLETDSTVDELASVLSGWEATASGTMQTQRDHINCRIELVHQHLPLLANAGLIEYEPDNGSVQLETLHRRVAEIIRHSVVAEDRSMSPNDA